jgi:hypothetical protein
MTRKPLFPGPRLIRSSLIYLLHRCLIECSRFSGGSCDCYEDLAEAAALLRISPLAVSGIAQSPNDWQMYGRDGGNSRCSPLMDINTQKLRMGAFCSIRAALNMCLLLLLLDCLASFK